LESKYIEQMCRFMVTPCINIIQHFNFQLIHTTLKNVELLEHFKLVKLLQRVSVYKETETCWSSFTYFRMF